MSIAYNFVRPQYDEGLSFVNKLESSGGCSSQTTGSSPRSEREYFSLTRPASIKRVHGPDGWRAPTSWSTTVYRVRSPLLMYTRYYPKFSGTCMGTPVTFQNVVTNPSSWIHAADLPSLPSALQVNRNVTKLLGKIKDEESINLSVAFAERKATEDLFSSGLRRIGDSVKSFRRLKRGDWKKVLSRENEKNAIRRKRPLSRREEILLRAPETWLEVTYGWGPVMSDIYGAMHAVDKSQNQNEFRFCHTAKTRVKEDHFYYKRTNLLSIAGLATIGGYCFKDVMHRVDYVVKTDVLPRLSELGLVNPALVAWELVPLSYVLDWAVPLGDWFNTFDATLGKIFKGGTATSVVRMPLQTLYARQWYSASGFDLSWSPQGAKGSVEYLNMGRSVLSSFPSAYPPTFRNPCSPSHIASALSLLTTAYGRGAVATFVRR